MSENTNQSFEEMAIETDQGIRPEGDLSDKQFTMKQTRDANGIEDSQADARQIRLEDSENVLSGYLAEINSEDAKGDEVQKISNYLESKKGQGEEDTKEYQELVKAAKDVLEAKIGPWFTKELARLKKELKDSPHYAGELMKFSLIDLKTFKEVGVDVKPQLQEFAAMLKDEEVSANVDAAFTWEGSLKSKLEELQEDKI